MIGQTVYLEIEFELRAQAGRSDNGMTGVHYQEFDEVEDIEVHDITIGGKTYSITELRQKIGKDAVDWLEELAIETSCPDSWQE